MKRALWLCTAIAVTSCYDFRKDLLDCVRAGQCAVVLPDGGAGVDGGATGDDGGIRTGAFREEICSSSHWCWQTPYPKNELSGVAALADNDVWVLGRLGNVMHYDGSAWSRMPRASSVSFNQVLVTGAHEFYAASSVGVWRYDGIRLAVIPGAGFTARDIAVFGSEIWALQPGNDTRVLKHYVSGAWVDVAAPKDLTITGAQPEVLGVWGRAANDVFFVGEKGLFFHWDGASFTVLPKVPSTDFPVLVIGGFGNSVFAGDGDGTVYRYTAPNWDNVFKVNGFIGSISGRAENDVWFGGQVGVTAHWNGTQVESTGNTSGCDVAVVSGITRAWAADECGNVYRRETSAWVPAFANGYIGLYRAVHGSSAADIWVGGEQGGMSHFDGTSWTESAISSAPIGSIWVLSPTSAFATESVDNPNVPTHVFHWDGSTWQSAGLAGQGSNGLWASPSGNAWAVGYKGTIIKVSPSAGGFTSTPQTSTVTTHLTSVAGSSDTDIWAAGEGGVIVHSTDGVTWSKVTSPVTDRIVSLWVEPGSTTNAWATTFSSTIHWDGTQWLPKPITDTQNRVITGSRTELLTANGEGGIQRGLPGTMSLEESGTKYWLRAAWEGEGGHPSVVVGDHGTILVRP